MVDLVQVLMTLLFGAVVSIGLLYMCACRSTRRASAAANPATGRPAYQTPAPQAAAPPDLRYRRSNRN